MWCVPELTDEYIERMEDLLDLYEQPLRKEEPVVCLDERPVQLRGEKRAGTPAAPGKPARYDYEYVRLGTANIFCAIEPLAGKHITKVTPTRSGAEFAKMLGEIARRYPKARTIHLVVDNLSTHSRRCVVRHYGEERGGALWARFTVHFTPRHGSWLNQAEIEISLLNRQGLGRRRFTDLSSLRTHVRAWNRQANAERLRIHWRFRSTDARDKFGYDPTESKQSED